MMQLCLHTNGLLLVLMAQDGQGLATWDVVLIWSGQSCDCSDNTFHAATEDELRRQHLQQTPHAYELADVY